MEGFAAMYMEHGEQRGIQKGKEATVLELVSDGTIIIEKGAQLLNVSVTELTNKIKQYR